MNRMEYADDPRTTLSAGINAVVTSLAVSSATGFPSSPDFVVKVGSELILVGAVAGTTYSSLTRGYDGTTAASHSSGDSVTMPLCKGSLEALATTSKAGTVTSRRRNHNYIDGPGASVTVADNSGSDRVDVTVRGGNPW